jgi:hypothetical protein
VNSHDHHLTSQEFNVLILLNDADTLHFEELSVGKLTNIKEQCRVMLVVEKYHGVFSIVRHVRAPPSHFTGSTP